MTKWMFATWAFAAHIGHVLAAPAPQQEYTYTNNPHTYRYRSYGQNVKIMKELEQKYPHLIELTTAQDAYGLPSPGSCTDADSHDVSCKQWIVRITDEATLPDVDRPEVFFSGCLHGDEMIGPTAVMEMMILLVEMYETNRWVRRMVHTRMIYMMPMTNALGYQNRRRGENGIDTNRDFPYNQKRCLRTVTGRAIYELWTRHLFQLAITFHAGMRAIAYEWGSNNHRSNVESPDDVAQLELAKVMSNFAAGKAGGNAWYPYKSMTELVYAVDGGMEDWAYAASWEPKYVHSCNPSNLGGYSPAQQDKLYNNVSMRTFNVLIETSDNKQPMESELGSTTEVFKANGKGDGHVPRNMRTMVVMLDTAQPYIETEPRGRHVVQDAVNIQWEVGGAIAVDSTRLLWGRWPSRQQKKVRNLASNRSRSAHHWAQHLTEDSPLVKGKSQNLKSPTATRWRLNPPRDIFTEPFKPVFKDRLSFPSDGEYFVVAVARVDAHMGDQHRPEPKTGPQSNYVNARLNDRWLAETKIEDEWHQHHRVRGKTLWHSRPIHIVVKSARSLTDAPTLSIDDEDPFAVPQDAVTFNSQPSPNPHWTILDPTTIVIVTAMVLGVVVAVLLWGMRKRDGGDDGFDIADV